MPDLRLHFLTQKNNLLKNDLDQQILNQIGFNTDISHSLTDLRKFLDQDRQQYNAIKIMETFQNQKSGKLILLTDVDLFIPIFTFVFGLAKLGGQTGIVSIYRLNNVYYGLPEDKELLTERTVKEIIHELGHLLGLKHCDNYKCVMTSSTVVDELDIKSSSYCNKCNININLY
jgi:archaemetzincin